MLSTIAPFLSPIAILVSAGAGAWFAKKTIDAQRGMARKRATLDVLIKLESDEYYQKVSATFRDVRDGPGLDSLVNPRSEREKSELLDVQSFLNHYELICVGIIECTLDEAFLYQWFRGTFIHHWHDSKSFVEKVRDSSKNRNIFQQYERFADAWDRNRFVTRPDDPQAYRNGYNKVIKQLSS